MTYRNNIFCQSCFDNYSTYYLGRLCKNKPKREFWQISTSKHQLQAEQDKEKPVTKCQHQTVGKIQVVLFTDFFGFCIMQSRLPTQWKARVASKQHHQVKLASQALQVIHKHALVGKNILMTQVQGNGGGHWQWIHGIAEIEWHESIQSILRKAVHRHTHTHTHTWHKQDCVSDPLRTESLKTTTTRPQFWPEYRLRKPYK